MSGCNNDGDLKALRARVVELEQRLAELQKTEQALREAEERFRAIADYTYDWENWIGPDGRLCWVNQAVERMTGYTPEECLAMVDYPLPIIHEDDREMVAERFRKAAEGPSGSDVSARIRRKDGSIRWVAASWQPMFSAEGTHLGRRSSIRDITERKQAEEALRASEEFATSLLNSSPNPIAVVNPDGSLKYVNPALEEATGFSSAELIGKKSPYPWWTEETLEKIASGFREAMRKGAVKAEQLFKRKDGERFWVQITARPVTRDGEFKYYLSNWVDITERKRAEEAALRAARLEATTVLAGGVAHDFNNLMVAVLGNAELLRSSVGGDAEVLAMLTDISESARRAGELAQQLLAFAGRGKYRPCVVNLNDILQQTLRLLDRSFPARVRVERDIQPELWNVEADPTQMRQVVTNLCTNAVEAIEAEGRIVVTTRNVQVDERLAGSQPDLPPGRYTYVSVEDTGRGMDAETRARVFEPFFSTKFEGRGLGLAAVHGIVRNHKGHISIESEEGRGSTVRVYLPATEAALERPVRRRAPLSTGTETVLLIDDEPRVLRATQGMLEGLGYRVLTAENGQEAVSLAQTFDGDIHLAILDLSMPIMGGAQAYPLLMEARPELKVIVCTGYALDAASQALLDAGASAFLQKPFMPEELATTIREALDQPSD